MNIWFTSDTHFGHANIIRYSKRPFSTVDEMDASLIERWNSVVKPGDTVYHLGDFSLVKNANLIEKYARSLEGHIHLVYGNHDAKRMQFLKGFAEVTPYKEIKIQSQKIILCHYAFRVWNGCHRGSWNLHGHSHGSLERIYTLKQIDVGTDCWNYTPLSFDQVAKEMEKSTFAPVDHHGEEEGNAEKEEGRSTQTQ